MSVLLWNSMQTRSVALPTVGDWGYELKEMLVAAGFVVRSSGTGSVFNPSGDSITSAAVMANASAWYMIESPDGARQWVVQHLSTGTGHSLWYSKTAAFAGGSASVVPTAGDSYQLANNEFMGSASGDFAIGAVEAAAPYSWWWSIVTSTGGLSQAFTHLAVEPFDPTDVDPYLFKPSTSTYPWGFTNTFAGWRPDGASVITNWDRNTPNPFPGVGALTYGFVWWWQSSAASLNKGWCRKYAQHTHDNTANARTFSTSGGGANQFIKINSGVFPWDGSAPLGPGSPTWNNLGNITFPQDLLKGC